MKVPPPIILWSLTLVFVTALTASCVSDPGADRRNRILSTTEGVEEIRENLDSEASLRADLRGFTEEALIQIEESRTRMREEASDTEELRHIDKWAGDMTDRMKRYSTRADPVVALTDLWGLCAALSEGKQDTDDSNLNEKATSRAIKTSGELRDEIESIAKKHVPDYIYKAMKKEIDAYAEENPLAGEPLRPQSVPISAAKSGVSTLVRAPLGIGSAIGSVGTGAVSGATGMNDIAGAIYRASDVAEKLPTDTRENTVTLAEQLNIDDKLTSTMLMLEEINATAMHISNTARQISDTAGNLPAGIEDATRGVMVEFTESQPELQNTIRESRGLTKDATGAISETKALTQELNATVQSLGQTSTALESLVKEVNLLANPPGKKDAPPSNAKPFDINEYRETVVSVQDVLAETRGLVKDLNETMDSDFVDRIADAVDEASARVAQNAQTQTADLVNLITIRLAQLFVLLFGLLVVYQVIVYYLRRRQSSSAN